MWEREHRRITVFRLREFYVFCSYHKNAFSFKSRPTKECKTTTEAEKNKQDGSGTTKSEKENVVRELLFVRCFAYKKKEILKKNKYDARMAPQVIKIDRVSQCFFFYIFSFSRLICRLQNKVAVIFCFSIRLFMIRITKDR